MREKKRGRQIKRPPLVPGDYVRYALLSKALEKTTTFWSKEIYQVMSVEEPAHEWQAARYTLHDGRNFTRDRLQKVDPDQLVRLVVAQPPTKPATNKSAARPSPPPPPVRAQPQRGRAPSSRLKNSFLDM